MNRFMFTLHSIEQMVKSSYHNTRVVLGPNHGVSLPSASCTISKDSCIVTIENIFNKMFSSFIVNFFLC